MAQLLTALGVPVEGQDSVPSAHMVTYNQLLIPVPGDPALAGSRHVHGADIRADRQIDKHSYT